MPEVHTVTYSLLLTASSLQCLYLCHHGHSETCSHNGNVSRILRTLLADETERSLVVELSPVGQRGDGYPLVQLDTYALLQGAQMVYGKSGYERARNTENYNSLGCGRP